MIHLQSYPSCKDSHPLQGAAVPCKSMDTRRALQGLATNLRIVQFLPSWFPLPTSPGAYPAILFKTGAPHTLTTLPALFFNYLLTYIIHLSIMRVLCFFFLPDNTSSYEGKDVKFVH
jgi:hypothetical protein